MHCKNRLETGKHKRMKRDGAVRDGNTKLAKLRILCILLKIPGTD